jgi:hypothetical protein
MRAGLWLRASLWLRAHLWLRADLRLRAGLRHLKEPRLIAGLTYEPVFMPHRPGRASVPGRVFL